MTKVLLISENYLRSAFMISDNVQTKFILPAIQNAQEMEFQTVVGNCLYKRLLEGVAENNLNDNEKELLNIAKRYIGYVAISELITISTFKINNIGLNKTKDDNVETLPTSDVMLVKKQYIDKADFYKKRLQEYLLRNQGEFPELSCCDCHNIKKNLYSAASCNLWLGGPRGK